MPLVTRGTRLFVSRRVSKGVSTMMARHMTWGTDGAKGTDQWVAKVITPNKLSSAHEFAAACKAARDPRVMEWENKKLLLREHGVLNDVLVLAEGELTTLGTASCRSVAPSDPSVAQNLMLAMASMNFGFTLVATNYTWPALRAQLGADWDKDE